MTLSRDRQTLTLASLAGLSLCSCALGAESIASRWSAKWNELKTEAEGIGARLADLPPIPGDDLGSLRAFLYSFASENTLQTREVDFTIRIWWDQPETIDLIALVPARKFDARGLQPNYGFPDDFTIRLIDAEGEPHEVANHTATSQRPAHRGHPLLETLDEPLEAIGIELHITRLRPIPSGAPQIPMVALSEIFCFAGARNVAELGRVEISGSKTIKQSRYWSPGLLNDGLTPLGLPEAVPEPGDPWPSLGWISLGRTEAEALVSIVIDLGEAHEFDGLRVFPALRPSIEDFPGFGIPQRFRIQASDINEPDSFQTLFDHTEISLQNPGHNPVVFRFPKTSARYVQLQATELWRPFASYPAFLALSEIQVLDDLENLSAGAPAYTDEQKTPVPAQGDRFWTRQGLTDNHGPSGELITRREWLQMLGLRLQLESRRLEISERMDTLEQSWRRGSILALTAVGGLILCAALFLPIRYRIRERRQIRRIRERIAGDLHDDVGTNLGSIQMLTALARSKNEPDDELELIHRVAAETVTSVRDIVWLLHPTPTSRVSTIDHLRESASILLEPLDWSLSADFRDWPLGDQDGRHLVLFFREALHNLRRHAEATAVTIRIMQDGESFVLVISDDGRGIDSKTLEQPSSLRSLRQRAENLGGSVEIQTLPGQGTSISLTFVPRAPGSAAAPVAHPISTSDAS